MKAHAKFVGGPSREGGIVAETTRRRTRRSASLHITMFVAAFGLFSASHAQVPQIINYQGRVAVGGTNFTGTGQFKFALVNAGATATYWSNGNAAVSLAVSNGLYAVLLGDIGIANMTFAIPATVFTNSDVRLRVQFDDGVTGFQTFSPDQRLAAVGYAMMAAGVNSTGDLVGRRLKIGGGHTLTGDLATIAGGTNNTASGAYSVVGGGYDNTASGENATVGGGISNAGTNYLATIAGGNANVAGHSASVGGGQGNRASGTGATIGGGGFDGSGFSGNIAGGAVATIGGGLGNNASGARATIGGGYANWASTNYTTIGGGLRNTVSGFGATVGGGSDNGASHDYATVAGGTNNTATVPYATVSGGQKNTASGFGGTVGGGVQNGATNNFATVAGGVGNIAGNSAFVGGGQGNLATGTGATVGGGGYDGFSFGANIASGAASTVSGGFSNLATAANATVGGGFRNTASGAYSTVGGGPNNTASGINATVAGGAGNTASEYAATVAGGFQNRATNTYATVPGGSGNLAGGVNSLAAGSRAAALHDGAFVWADGQDVDFASTTTNQFSIRANGGVRLNDDTSLFCGAQVRQMFNLWGTQYGIGIQSLAMYYRVDGALGTGFAWYRGGSHNDNHFDAGGGTTLMQLDSSGLTVNGVFVSVSDRNMKENFRPVQPHEVLEKVAALPITEWNFKTDSATRHIGPVAQDFRAAFGVGADDKHIATVDADGVALAAIKGLYEVVKEKDERIAELEKRLADIERKLQEGGK